jgi:hypothetical protein
LERQSRLTVLILSLLHQIPVPLRLFLSFRPAHPACEIASDGFLHLDFQHKGELFRHSQTLDSLESLLSRLKCTVADVFGE